MASVHPASTDTEFFRRQIERALSAQIAAELKAPLMAQAEAAIDNAVGRAVEALKPRIETAVNDYHRTFDVRIFVDRPAIKAEQGEQT